MNKKKILIITDAYPPEARSSSHLMKEMADGLKERGHDVFVITSRPSGGLAGVFHEDGIVVIRANVLPHHNVNFILKGISQLMLPYIFFRNIKKYIKGKLDIVWVHSPPLPLTITARLVTSFYKARYILNLQDFFPQNAIDLGILKNRFLIEMFEKMEKRAYKESDVIVTPSEAHKSYMNDRYAVPLKKIHVIPHWIDTKPFQEAKRTNKFRELYLLEGKFIFAFGGILGPSQNLDIFIRIAEKLKKYKDVTFLFVGEGSEKNRLQSIVEKAKLQNVIFKPLISKEEYPYLLKDVDVGILSLSSANTTPAVPAKLMGYMAAGLPILAFLHKASDGIRIVQEAKCGLATASDNESAMLKLAEQMYLEKENLSMYGMAGLRYVREHFSKDICLDKIEESFRADIT